jgi:hypothetical protein
MIQIADKITPVTSKELFASLRRAWLKLFGAPPEKFTLVILVAHWALETGHGRAMHNFNVGNLKSDGTGTWCSFGCNEVLDDVDTKLDAGSPGARFRAYESLDAGVEDYLQTLRGVYWWAFNAAKSGEAAEFSKRLKAAYYYTADESKYTDLLVSIAAKYDKELVMWPPLDGAFAKWVQGDSNWLDIVCGTVGWGYGDNPPGRRQAYCDLIAPNDSPSAQKAYGKLSGCALSALGWLRCWGLDDAELWQPYHPGRAVADVVAIARRHGAWCGPDTIPELGDLVLVGGPPGFGGAEHVFCCLGITDGVCSSVDGGQVEHGEQAIHAVERYVTKRDGGLWIGSRRVAGVARVNRMVPARGQVRPVACEWPLPAPQP